MQNLAVVGGISLVAALLVLVFIRARIVYICPPNAVLIFSGGHHKSRRLWPCTIGYRVVQGGRGIRIPLYVEVVDRMDLTNMMIELKRVQGAKYSEGRHPAQRAGRRERQGVEQEGEQLAERDRAGFPRHDARRDHGGRARDARGQPARRAVDADAGEEVRRPGPREVRQARNCSTRPITTSRGSDSSSTRSRSSTSPTTRATSARSAAGRPPSCSSARGSPRPRTRRSRPRTAPRTRRTRRSRRSRPRFAPCVPKASVASLKRRRAKAR